MNERINNWKRQPLIGKCQYLCLLVVALVELVYMSPIAQGLGIIWTIVDYFLEVPAMVFLMLSIARGINRRGRSTMVVCLSMLLWVSLVQVMRAIRCMEQIAPGEIACFYALALPMAFAMDDGREQRGLNVLVVLYLLESLRLCILGGALFFGVLPERFADRVYWEGERLLEMLHPTNCAALLMIGIGLCLGLCFRAKKHWQRGLLIVFIVIQFLIQTLTNGRTSMALTCLLIGGVVFCAIRKSGAKRTGLAVAVSVVLMAALFTCSRQLFALHQNRMIQASFAAAAEQEPQAYVPMEDREVLAMADVEALSDTPQDTAPAEETEAPEPVPQETEYIRQGSFLEDLVTFNYRTYIWEEAVKGLARNPKIMICGSDNIAAVLLEGGRTTAMHTHNSLLETIYYLGIPGLILALVITVMAIRDAIKLLRKNDDLWKSMMAVLVICMLGCGVLEPYLFVARNNQHYLTLFFLAAVGYLHQWCVEEKA